MLRVVGLTPSLMLTPNGTVPVCSPAAPLPAACQAPQPQATVPKQRLLLCDGLQSRKPSQSLAGDSALIDSLSPFLFIQPHGKKKQKTKKPRGENL